MTELERLTTLILYLDPNFTHMMSAQRLTFRIVATWCMYDTWNDRSQPPTRFHLDEVMSEAVVTAPVPLNIFPLQPNGGETLDVFAQYPELYLIIEDQDLPCLPAMFYQTKIQPFDWREWTDPYNQLMTRNLRYQHGQNQTTTEIPAYLIEKVKRTARWLKSALEAASVDLVGYQIYCSYCLFVEPLTAALTELTEVMNWITARLPDPPLTIDDHNRIVAIRPLVTDPALVRLFTLNLKTPLSQCSHRETKQVGCW